MTATLAAQIDNGAAEMPQDRNLAGIAILLSSNHLLVLVSLLTANITPSADSGTAEMPNAQNSACPRQSAVFAVLLRLLRFLILGRAR